MSYTLENTKELFLVTKDYDNFDTLNIVMSRKEVQEELKGSFAHLVSDIRTLKITPVETVSKKYFLPKDWNKIHPKAEAYRIWKEIFESEEE